MPCGAAAAPSPGPPSTFRCRLTVDCGSWRTSHSSATPSSCRSSRRRRRRRVGSARALHPAEQGLGLAGGRRRGRGARKPSLDPDERIHIGAGPCQGVGQGRRAFADHQVLVRVAPRSFGDHRPHLQARGQAPRTYFSGWYAPQPLVPASRDARTTSSPRSNRALSSGRSCVPVAAAVHAQDEVPAGREHAARLPASSSPAVAPSGG